MAVGADCDGGSFDNGWIIFVDTNGDIVRAGAAEPVLRKHPPVPDAITITPAGGASYFSFAPSGLGRGDVGVGPSFSTAVICDDRGNRTAGGGYSSARYIVVTPIGRSTVVRDVDMIDNAGGCP
jgi:hypothetical protein